MGRLNSPLPSGAWLRFVQAHPDDHDARDALAQAEQYEATTEADESPVQDDHEQ